MVRRRGIGSIVASIFLVIIMGISLMAFISVYNKYKEFALTASEMNEWESQRLKENLVRLGPIGGGGGTPTRTVSMTFLVAEDHYYPNSWLVTPNIPREWRYDEEDGQYIFLNTLTNYMTYIIKINKFDGFAGETWNFLLQIVYRSPTTNLKVDIYDFSTSNWVYLDTLPSSTSFVKKTIPISKSYVHNNLIRIRIRPQFIFSTRIDQLILKGNLTYSNLYYGNFTPGESTLAGSYLPKFEKRDGNYAKFLNSGGFQINITGLPAPTQFRSITAFITLGAVSPDVFPLTEWKVKIEAYDFSASSWNLLNTTGYKVAYFSPKPEERIRIPLSDDYVSPDNKIMLRISYTKTPPWTHSELRIDEIVADAIWIQSGGGGGGGGGTPGNLTIRNDSPFAVTIVRFYFINSTDIIIYDPSPEIVLKPGETLDLSTIHSLDDITQIKIITSRGNVFSYIP